MPQRLRGLHWVNFFDPRGYERLLRALRQKTEAKAETESKAKVKPAAGKRTPPKPRPEVPPGDTYLGGVREEEAIAYYRQHLSRLGGEIRPAQRQDEPQAKPQAPTPDPQPPSTRLPFEPEMILIPAGEFLMGSDPKKDEYARENEQPQHALSLPDYYMAKTPVTNTQYVAFVQASGYKPPEHWQNKQPPHGQENHPVVNVSWDDAVAYCRWLAKTTGKPYRLPGEAEWEKGARGTDGRIYPWGNEWDANRCNSSEGGKGGTTPVDAYPAGASPYGLLDMSGNVWEWCSTIWQGTAYPFQVQDEWTKVYPDRTDVLRVLRGGSFIDNDRRVRCASRYWSSPHHGVINIGFRVVGSPFS